MSKSINVNISDNIKSLKNLDGLKITWDDFYHDDEIISIPYLLYSNKEKYRSQILDWIDSIGTKKIGNRSLQEYLNFFDGPSYWWMTSLGQKECFSNSSGIYFLIKLLVLEDIIENYEIKNFQINLSNKKQEKLIKSSLSISNPLLFFNLNFFYSLIKSALMLFYSSLRFSFFCKDRVSFKKNKEKNINKKYKISIFDIFTHLDLSKESFTSLYWTVLVDYFRSENLPISWNHFYYKDRNKFTLPKALEKCSKFNKYEKDSNHQIIDKLISLREIWNINKTVVSLWFKYISLSSRRNLFDFKKSKFNALLIIQDDLMRSMCGYKAYKNIFYNLKIKKLLSNNSKNSLGIYIQENQPWEYSLNYFWKKFNDTKIIGVPHTTVRFFDLRYFFSKNTFLLPDNSPPFPNLIVTNGLDTYKKFSSMSHLPCKVLSVEALRYVHLNDLIKETPRPVDKIPKILVVGDLFFNITMSQIEFILLWKKKLNPNADITFLPHPAADLRMYNKYKNLITISSNLINEINNYDLFFFGNSTSGVIDIYQLGLPLIIYNDPKLLNLSPLLDFKDVKFVNDIYALDRSVIEILNKEISSVDYFNINKEIPLWKNLIYQNID